MKTEKLFLILVAYLLSGLFSLLSAQVKITDGADLTINPNSLLELESSARGLLLPRIALNSLDQPDPLSSPVPAGMLIYSSGGLVADGFYYWSGSKWISFNVAVTLFTKSASATLLKTETFVLATGDITLTLPAVTAADDGLAVTVKNAGTHTDLIAVGADTDATIDGIAGDSLTRWCSQTYIAWNGNWITKVKNRSEKNRIVVSSSGSFTTLAEAVDYLNAHMTAPTVVVLSSGVNTVTETLVIDLPYPVTFEGESYGAATIGPGAGMTGKPLFDCLTDCSFKMISFDGGTISGYGSSLGEDAIDITENGTYHEIKDCSFDGFYNAVAHLSDAELWVFECDINNSANSGLLLNSPVPGSIVKVSETDFTGNRIGVNLSAGSATTVTLNAGFYTNLDPADIAILYNPSGFSFSNLIITGNSWNFIGTGISGFDFTRQDGRDANAFIENNAGVEDDKPHCKINVVNNALTTTCVTSNSWYKANWVNTSSYTTNLVIGNNKITYQSVKPRDIFLIISGDVSVGNNNRVVTVGIVKNGVTTTRYGETALRITTANQPFQFSTVIYQRMWLKMIILNSTVLHHQIMMYLIFKILTLVFQCTVKLLIRTTGIRHSSIQINQMIMAELLEYTIIRKNTGCSLFCSS